MGMPGLPLVAELGHRPLLAVRDEHRVEAEAGAAASFLGDPALKRARAAQLAAVRSDRDQLADVARPAVLLARQGLEDPLDVPALRPASRLDARPPGERLDLEPGVLAEQPAVRAHAAPEQRLAACVLVERGARLRGIVRDVEQLDAPAGQRELQLAALVLVLRAQDQRSQRASSTSSSRATSSSACERRSRSMRISISSRGP